MVRYRIVTLKQLRHPYRTIASCNPSQNSKHGRISVLEVYREEMGLGEDSKEIVIELRYVRKY